MSDRFFLDTNIFAYTFDSASARKAALAGRLIHDALDSHKGVISFQVVHEFFNLALRKFRHPMSIAQAEQYLATVFRPLLTVHSSAALCSEALRLHGQGGLSWYDALIVSAAQASGCDVLFSEDLQHGRKFGKLQIKNPFL
jgi:predicted nucleic acid-binding protein